MGSNGDSGEQAGRLAEAQENRAAAEYGADGTDRREAAEQKVRVQKVRDALAAAGMEVGRPPAPYSPPHGFVAYPGPGRPGCVRCPYPQVHAVHRVAG